MGLGLITSLRTVDTIKLLTLSSQAEVLFLCMFNLLCTPCGFFFRSFSFLIKYVPSNFGKTVFVVVSSFFASYGKCIQAWYEISWFSSRFCPEFKEFKCNYSVADNLNIPIVRQLWKTLKCFKNSDASADLQLSYILHYACTVVCSN